MTGHHNVNRAVHVEKQRLTFAAAHMATLGDALEPLHGHNYAVSIEVEGDLSDEGWIVDFGLLKRIGREICGSLDHRFLLQGRSPLLGMRHLGEEWEISYGDKRYRFPAPDVLELPVMNTTTEQLAELFWMEVLRGIQVAGATNVRRLRIGVEEAPGQAGWFAADVPAKNG